MKKYLFLLFSILSVSACFAQSSSLKQSGYFTRVNDSTTYEAAAATAHAQGYSDIYYNAQSPTPHFKIWNGASYDHVFDFNAGGGGGGTQDLQSVLDEGSTASVTTPIEATVTGATDYSVVSWSDSQFEFANSNNDNTAAIGIQGTAADGIKITDTRFNKGLQGVADFSANITATDYTQKVYVDAKIANSITNGVTTSAPNQDQVFDALALKQTTTLAQNNILVGNSSNIATAYPLGYVTPQMFGAVMDGSTDDQAAINAALAASDYVYFLPGNYRIATTLTTDDDDHLLGSGNASIISVASNIAAITIGGINNQISSLQILGSGSGAAQNGITAVGNGSFNLYRYNTRVENCFFNNLGNAGMYTINTIGNSSGSEHQGTYYAINCRATSCAVGYLMDTRGEYNTFSNCLADDCPVGVRFNGGNNAWTGGNVVDCTIGVFIGSGTNDGHGVISGGRINHSNVTCTSTATGYAFSGVEIVASSISLTSCTDIRFYNCDFSASPITSTSSVGTIFLGNCFRTTPTITVAAGNTPSFLFNTFPSGSTVHSLIQNTVQGGIAITQQGPTSPNTTTSTWTTTASGQYSQRMAGTITPRATASDLTSGLILDYSHTQTANTQIFYDLDINPTGTLATGGFTGTENGALRTRGRIRHRGIATTGAVGALSGWSYEDSGGANVLQVSDDGIMRIGNAGSAAQLTTTSDGTTLNKAGNGLLFSMGGLGANFSASSTAGGNTGAGAIKARGTYSNSSAALPYYGVEVVNTLNQTGTASGSYYGLYIHPTVTAMLGTEYGMVSESSTALSGVGGTPTATWHVIGTTKLQGSVTLPVAGNGLLIKEGTNATMGVATLVGGTVTVNTTKVTANSRIFLTGQNLGTITVPVGYAISARTPGTSFTILSANAIDTSDVAWEIIEPAP